MDPEIVTQTANQVASSTSSTGFWAVFVSAVLALWGALTGFSVRRNIAAIDQRHADAVERIDDLEEKVASIASTSITQPAFNHAMERLEKSVDRYTDEMKKELGELRSRVDAVIDRRQSPR